MTKMEKEILEQPKVKRVASPVTEPIYASVRCQYPSELPEQFPVEWYTDGKVCRLG